MNKIIIFFIIITSLFLTSSCSKSEEKINEEIVNSVIELISYNFELNNIKITYDDYKQRVFDYFVSEDKFNEHLKYNILNPTILEDVTTNDSARIKEYESLKKNYDLLDIKISKIYNDSSSTNKYVYIHMILSPTTHKKMESGLAYTSQTHALNEERNIKLELIQEKRNWKISNFEGNSYLVELKDKLSKEFINRYTAHDNIEVEYIEDMEFIND
ncbi:hypothetical protein GC105_03785 [Alkalibaculum sp. M08DMB]|uniref:Lipoprotein n=1 Tax=Alkalibaculum sporogenes TaxID=2655001 RepID=A0A6A7K6E4_9FIRM|nr:hypothetical protein [Alkalibaculum sporogenes]MPW24911.1 hypothetical protein [Alkalibaculum sporogenes]